MILALAAFRTEGQLVRSVTIEADNDYFNFWIPPRSRPDVGYTHGTRISVESEWPALWLLFEPDVAKCEPTQNQSECAFSTFELGQEVYTPFTEPGTFVGEDRPYAGWLYAGVVAARANEQRLRTVGIVLGVTGPPSMAEASQRRIHEWFGFREPIGWERQLAFEPGIIVQYDDALSFLLAGSSKGWALRVEPGVMAQIGNVHTDFEARAAIHAGYNAGFVSSSKRTSPYFSLKLIGHQQVVARNLFLDGNTWVDSPRVEKHYFVRRGEIEVAARFGIIEAGYSVIGSSREFVGQPEPHTYSSLKLGVSIR